MFGKYAVRITTTVPAILTKYFIVLSQFSQLNTAIHLDFDTSNHVLFHILSHLNFNYVYCFQIFHLRVFMSLNLTSYECHLLVPSLGVKPQMWPTVLRIRFFLLKLKSIVISLRIVFVLKEKINHSFSCTV